MFFEACFRAKLGPRYRESLQVTYNILDEGVGGFVLEAPRVKM